MPKDNPDTWVTPPPPTRSSPTSPVRNMDLPARLAVRSISKAKQDFNVNGERGTLLYGQEIAVKNPETYRVLIESGMAIDAGVPFNW